MKRVFVLIIFLLPLLLAQGQQIVHINRQVSLGRWGIEAGNYSGITWLGGSRYAVCDDKAPDGFYIWEIDIDERKGKIKNIHNEGFRQSGAANCDAEDISFVPEVQTIFMVSEAESRVHAYQVDGAPLEISSPTLLLHKAANTGLEGLCYDKSRQCLWVTEENNGQGECTLLSLGLDLIPLSSTVYKLDEPRTQSTNLIHIHGISAVCALPNGKLLVMEREAFVPQKKIGAWVHCKLFIIAPDQPWLKTKITEFHTRLNLTSRSWANYEGMCLGPTLKDGRHVLLLLSDSQNNYGGVLRDRLRTVILDLNESTLKNLSFPD